MNTKNRTFATLLLLLIGIYAQPQEQTPELHKRIWKTMEKTWDADRLQLDNLPVPDSVIRTPTAKGLFYKVSQNNNLKGYLYTGRVNTCRASGCDGGGQTRDTGETAQEYFDYCILFSANKQVLQVKVYEYAATHGHEITAKRWLQQFKGYDGSHILKAEKDIDGISGATISVYAITDDVNQKTRLLNSLLHDCLSKK